MLDILYNAVKSELGLSHVTDILHAVSFIIENVGEEYLKDGNLRNDVIDAIIKILEKEKV